MSKSTAGHMGLRSHLWTLQRATTLSLKPSTQTALRRPSSQHWHAAEQPPPRDMDDLIPPRSLFTTAAAGAREIATTTEATAYQIRVRLLNSWIVCQTAFSRGRRLHAFRTITITRAARVSWSNLQAAYWRMLAQHSRGLTSAPSRKAVAVALALIAAAVIAFAWMTANTRVHTTSSRSEDPKKTESVAPKKDAGAVPKIPDSVLLQGWPSLEEAYQSYVVRVGPDGTLRTADRTIRLYGVAMPSRSQVCTYRNGERWACGQRAYIALLNFVGTTTIACRSRDTDRPELLLCRLAGIDIGEWMLRNGWANLADGIKDKDYVSAARAGSTSKLGVWADSP
jgi:endonuclease YncB( thermonuclease family)